MVEPAKSRESECQCHECLKRRESVVRMKALREELRRTSPGFGVHDWEDLAEQCRVYREKIARERGKS